MTTTAGRTRPTDLIDLDADHPPLPPVKLRRGVVSVRMPPALQAWITEQARVEHITFNAWIVTCLARARDESMPVDVRDWLAAQAAQCGCPGDIDQALTLVVRHLSMRWPHGGRLR